MKNDDFIDVIADSPNIDNSVREADFTDHETNCRSWYRFKGDPYKILHNINGPAIIFGDGEARHYRDGFLVASPL